MRASIFRMTEYQQRIVLLMIFGVAERPELTSLVKPEHRVGLCLNFGRLCACLRLCLPPVSACYLQNSVRAVIIVCFVENGVISIMELKLDSIIK